MSQAELDVSEARQRERQEEKAVVFLVHGTFAGAPSPDGEPKKWWEPGSVWSKELTRTLKAKGQEVECRQLQWPDPHIGPGPNRETDRRRGGETIFKDLQKFEQKNPGRPYHIVAHSHGGSVVWHALVAAAAHRHRLRGLKSWTTVGTPFLSFRSARSEFLNPLIALGVMLVLLVIWLSYFWAHAPEGAGELASIADFLAEPPPGKEPVKLLALLFEGRMVPLVAVLFGLGSVFAFAYVVARFYLEVLLKYLRFSFTKTGIVRKLASTVVAVVVVSLCAAFVGGNANAMVLPLVLAALLLNLAVAVRISLRLVEMAGLWIESNIRRRHEALAASIFGWRWRGLVHPSDEALALLTASLMQAPPIRPAQRSSNDAETGLSLDTVTQPLVDQATWRALTQYATGDDRDGLTSARCSRSPFDAKLQRAERGSGLFRFTKEVDEDLARNANDSVRQMAVALRDRLVALSSSKTDLPEHSLMANLSFNGLIHTSYFRLPEEGASVAGKAAQAAGGKAQQLILQQIARWIADGRLKDMQGQASRKEKRQLPGRGTVLVPHEGPAVEGIEHKPEHPPEREFRETTLRERFRNLETVSAMAAVAVGAITALTLIVPTEIWVKPLTRASYQIAAKTLPFDEPLTLRTGDAPAAAAYALRLAVVGELNTDEKIRVFLRHINQPNTRAAVAQRLAFGFAVAGQGDLAKAVVAHSRGPSTLSSSIMIERLQSLTQLSASYGHVMAGMRWSAKTQAVFDAAEVAWNETREGSSKISVHTCEDADTRATTALYVPVKIRGLLNKQQWNDLGLPIALQLLEVASYLGSSCIHTNIPINAEQKQQRARAWAVAVLIEVAQAAHSWHQFDIAKAALQAAGMVQNASLPDSDPLAGWRNMSRILKDGEATVLNHCLALVRSFEGPGLLGYRTSPLPPGCNSKSPDKHCIRLTDTCSTNRNTLLARFREGNCTQIADNTDGFLCSKAPARFNQQYRKVIDECRSEPTIARGPVRAHYDEALEACGAVGEHSALASIAAVLVADLFTPASTAKPLIETIGNTAHRERRLHHLIGRGLPMLEPRKRLPEDLAAIQEVLNGLFPLPIAENAATEEIDRARIIREQHVAIWLAKGFAPDKAMKAAHRVAYELNNHPSRLKPEEAIAGIGAILAADPVQAVLHDGLGLFPVAAADILAHPSEPHSLVSAARQTTLLDPLPKQADLDGPFKLVRRIAEMLIASPTSEDGKHVAGHSTSLAGSPNDPSLRRIVHRLNDERRESIETATLALETIPHGDRRYESVHRVLRQHTEEVAGRDLLVRRLAPIIGLHAANRDFNRAALVLKSFGDRSLSAIFNCRVLDDLIDLRDGMYTRYASFPRSRFGLQEDRRWPQLAPVRFGQGPRFAFPEPQGGGVPCRVTRDYNVVE